MLYLLGSVLLFSVNNVLWSYFSEQLPTLVIIKKRAVYTSLFTGLLLIGFVYFQVFDVKLEEQIQLLGMSLIGCLGLISLVKGFKNGSLLQFAFYSLLLTFGLGIYLEGTSILNQRLNWLSLSLVAVGYVYFIWVQFKTKQRTRNYLAHLYFAFAHLCFGVLLLLQWQFLESVSQLNIAFTQELVVLSATSLLVLVHQPETKISQKIAWWQLALFSLPITLAVLLGLEGLKSTNPFHSALIGLLTPIFTLLLGTLTKQEHLNLSALPGLLILVLGMGLFYLI